MLRESQISLNRTSDGNWEGEVYVPTADEHTERTPPSVVEDTDQIKAFLDGERNDAVGSVNWVAGGMLLFLNTADGLFIPVGWRDADAPSYSERLCTASGIADDYADVMNPRLVGYREALEEVLIYNTDTESWLLPTDSSIGLDEHSITNELHRMWQSTERLDSDTPVETVPATVHPIGSDTFTIYPPSETDDPTEITGHFVLDEGTRNVDIVDALVVDIPDVSIEDIRLFDGEEIGGDLLDREVYLFTPAEFKSLFNGSATALRAFKTGQFKSDDGLTTSFEAGQEVTRDFDGVPTLTESHSELVKFLGQF